MKQPNRTTFLKPLISLVALAITISPAYVFAMHHEEGNDFAKAWAAADEARAEVAKIDNEWGNTAKMLEQAKKAHAAGDKATALKLVAAALEESKDAMAQAERENDLWQARVPSKK